MASVKITVFGMQCLGDNMEAILFSSKIFVNFYLLNCITFQQLVTLLL